MGAVGEDGVRVLDDGLVGRLGIAAERAAAVERRERAALDDRIARIRARHPRVDLIGRTAVVVDDGIATGATATAACRVARGRGADRVVMAAPVGPPDAAELVPDADEVVCLVQPSGFRAVGAAYLLFGQTTDAEVDALLGRAP
jgi:putative phosphoribosyl transferase